MEKNFFEKHLENYIKNLFKGTIFNFIGEIIKRLTGYIYQVLLVRLFGTAIYGIYTISYSIINVVLRISCLGLDRGGIRYISILKEENKKETIKKLVIFLFLLSFFSGIFWAFITYLFSPLIANLYKKFEVKNGLIYFSISLPFYTSLLVMAYSSRGFNKMSYYVLSENFSRPILQIIFLFLLFNLIGKKLAGSILPWFFSSFLSLILILYFFKKEISFNEKDENYKFNYKEVIIFSYPIIFISILYFLFAWTDIIMLGLFRKAEEVGIYNGIARTAEMTNVFLLSINEVFSPFISQLSYKRDIESLKILFRVIIRWTLYFSFPLYIFFILSGKEFLIFIFGKEFEVGYLPMIILLSGLMYQNAAGESPMTLTMSGYQREWALATLIGLLINIFLAISLIPNFGIIGASLSTCISLIILRSIGIWEVKKFLKFNTHDLKTLKPLLQGFFCLILLYPISLIIKNFIKNFVIMMILNIFLCYGIYFMFFIIFKFEKEEKIIIEIIKKFFKEKKFPF
jgi:O-antigen/teichoic acid export membrane protein